MAVAVMAGALLQSCPAALTETGNWDAARLSAKKLANTLFVGVCR